MWSTQLIQVVLHKLSTHPSVLRRAAFAATFYPRSMPSFWNHLACFSLMNREERSGLTTEEVRMFLGNVEALNKDTLAMDLQLWNGKDRCRYTPRCCS